MRIKVGIFFGGPSREREISFAGGRTVYDNLDQGLFEAVPIFVDSFRRWYLLDWQYLYRGTIRDFFPPIDLAPKSAFGFQVYQESLGPQDELSLEAMGRKVGRRIRRHELPELIDVAFLALHGEYGEDGQLQRELEYAGVPYTGSGVAASELGMDKALQKAVMSERGFAAPALVVIEQGDFDGPRVAEHFARCEQEIGWPMVVRPARQGSSIGVAILEESDGHQAFERAVNAAFFRELLPLDEYAARNDYERLEYVRQLSDLRDGLAFPLDATHGDHTLTLYTPDDLHAYLEKAVNSNASNVPPPPGGGAGGEATKEPPTLLLVAHQTEQRVIVESFIEGKEFSTIVVRTDDGKVVALPPTEIVKPSSELFDYRSKYMPGRSRKVTPIGLPTDRIQAIRTECERLFVEMGFEVYARIDGFHTPGGGIYLNDPNTTSGMLPSSFFFHQAAEIGLNPSQFLTFIVRQSLRERTEIPGADDLGRALDDALDAQRRVADRKERIGVLLGGYSFERHISVESGRNIYEKLASSEGFRPVPLFLSRLSPSPSSRGRGAQAPPLTADEGNTTTTTVTHTTPATSPLSRGEGPGERRPEAPPLPQEEGPKERRTTLHHLPINLLLKDNADDIHDKLAKTEEHPVVADIRAACADLTARYADPDVVFHPRTVNWAELPDLIDGAFIALHGRPGEDGTVQRYLEELGIYYNGSGPASSAVTIDKYKTLRLLGDAGLTVTDQWLAPASDFAADPEAFYARVEREFGYPLIAKPVDDGCSSAVKLLRDRRDLVAYCALTFRPAGLDEPAARRRMKLTAKDEWPVGKSTILFERAIVADAATKFLEVTGGMLTHYGVDGKVRYEVFEPSETLAGGEVLSLEEKFLAGEGQNLTPARLGTEDYSYDYVAGQVKADLERAARAVDVQGYCRIDAFVRVFADGRVETVPIEINSLPGMTPATAIFHQAALAGYKPAQFIAQILAFGKARSSAAALRSLATSDEPEAVTPSVTSAESGDIDPLATVPPPAIPHPAIKSPDPAPAPAPARPNGMPREEPGAPQKTLLIPMQEEPPAEAHPTPATPPPTDDARPTLKDRALGTLKSTGRLLISGYFWKNALGALLFFVGCFFLLKFGLAAYTNHGDSTELPNFVDLSRAEAEDLADDLGLSLKFEKGAFDPNRPAGLVVLQHPKAGTGVKKNRSIYLTVLSDEAPLIQLPGLVGNYDYTQYTNRLEKTADIRARIRDRVYDPKLEENTILHFFYGDRKIDSESLKAGVKVPQGATLDFVISIRQTGEVAVPQIYCQRFGRVEFQLDASNLIVGEVFGNVSDRGEAYVVRTEPPQGKMVPVGSKFDIYLSQRKPDNCD